jgi:glycosyltransferase involved in cell wall biosynthesis
VHPPVDVDKFTLHTQKEDFYLTASRMVPYKRIDAVVDAFAAMPDKRLIVVGDGPDFERLKARAGPNVKLVGHQPFESLKTYMQRARAFVFAAEEDFGIVSVEAQACGTPVIAYGKGGAVESIVEGKTGLFFSEQTPESVRDAIGRFEAIEQWDPRLIRDNACRFSPEEFRTKLLKQVQSEWIAFNVSRPKHATAQQDRMKFPVGVESAPRSEMHDGELPDEIAQPAQAG